MKYWEEDGMKRIRMAIHNVLNKIFCHALGVAIGLALRFTGEKEKEKAEEAIPQPKTKEKK